MKFEVGKLGGWMVGLERKVYGRGVKGRGRDRDRKKAVQVCRRWASTWREEESL